MSKSQFDTKKIMNGEQVLPGEKFFTERTKVKVTGNIRVIVIGVIIGTLVFGVGGIGGQAVLDGIERARQENESIEEYLTDVKRCIATGEKMISDTNSDDIKDSSLLDKLQSKIDEAKQLDATGARIILTGMTFDSARTLYYYSYSSYCNEEYSSSFYTDGRFVEVYGDENDGNFVREITDILNEVVWSKKAKANEAAEAKVAEEAAKNDLSGLLDDDCTSIAGTWRNSSDNYSIVIGSDCMVGEYVQLRGFTKQSDGTYNGVYSPLYSETGGAAVTVYPIGVNSYATIGTKTAVGDNTKVRILITQSAWDASSLAKELQYKQ
ncbi:hypothetical protein FACS189431_0650 [Alphaproteobacteria bacterium]|nr:hypothetical protein FACS189431_0650 [Alphaproteobacteria bacterium]